MALWAGRAILSIDGASVYWESALFRIVVGDWAHLPMVPSDALLRNRAPKHSEYVVAAGPQAFPA